MSRSAVARRRAGRLRKSSSAVSQSPAGITAKFIRTEKKRTGARAAYTKYSAPTPDFPTDRRPSPWAWGNSRVFDLLESLPEIDAEKIGVTGHSRLGRTSILTAAYDKRFALVLANNPGHMGAALSRRRFGESVKHITTLFPFWFSKNLNKYRDNEGELPIDQHHMLACVAPRALYVASASKVFGPDPKRADGACGSVENIPPLRRPKAADARQSRHRKTLYRRQCGLPS